MNARTQVTTISSLAVFLAVLALPAQGQVAVGDARWLPFVGCWVPEGGGGEAGLLCFRPAAAGAVMFSVQAGEVTSSEAIAADGERRPVSSDGCSGFESVSFSEDGTRAFTRSEFDCAGDVRSGTGVMSFVAPTQWVDVRSLEIDGEPVAWVQRYALADRDELGERGIEDPAAFDRARVRATRARAAREIDVADVEEAAAQLDPRAVEVWIATQETELELSGAELVRLADAGVPESVIDVMVAVSYPDRFAVSPEGAAEEAAQGARAYRSGYRRGFSSYLWSPFYGPFGYGYGFYSPFGYAPFGYYGLYGGYGGYYGYRPATIVVQPLGSRDRGRMVPGRGYTRGSSTGSSSPGARPRSSSRRPAASSSGGGGGGGASRSSGSSGSSGSSSGRTARRR